jgi:DNA-binding NtrC family response regulator
MYYAPILRTQQQQLETGNLAEMSKQNKILVFSPDRDLAQILSMLFENHFEMACETALGNLQSRISSVRPSLLIIHLHTFSSDVMHQLKIVEASNPNVPIVVLRAYNRLRADVEDLVQRMATVVFYKPINAEEVVKSIHDLLKM